MALRFTLTIAKQAACTCFLCFLAACATTPPPPALDLALTRASPNKHFIITLVPPTEPIRVQQFHEWQIKVATSAGEPLTNALVYLNAAVVEGAQPIFQGKT